MKQPTVDAASSLTIQQIRTFCAVYECGGYADAARQSDQTGTTMWEQIKVLQRIYRCELFRRKGRGIEPTASGEMLYHQLRPLLEGIESSFNLLAEQSGQAPAEICVVTGMRMMLEELGNPLAKFTRQFPKTMLKLMTADNRTAQQMVAGGSVDVALLIEPPGNALLDGLSIQRLYPIEYLAVIPSRHRLAKKKVIRVADLLDESIVAGNPDTVGRQLLEQAVFRMGSNLAMKVAIETDNSAVTIACVRAGMGVGIIAGKVDGKLMKQVTTRSLSDELGQVHVVSVTRSGWQPTQIIENLLEHIQTAVAK